MPSEDQWGRWAYRGGRSASGRPIYDVSHGHGRVRASCACYLIPGFYTPLTQPVPQTTSELLLRERCDYGEAGECFRPKVWLVGSKVGVGPRRRRRSHPGRTTSSSWIFHVFIGVASGYCSSDISIRDLTWPRQNQGRIVTVLIARADARRPGFLF